MSRCWLMLLLSLTFHCSQNLFGQGDAALAEKGKQIYTRDCARCHGAKGEGVKDIYASELVGDMSVKQLANLISKTMPEDKKEKCSAEDSLAVARYVHDEFYSPIAQARRRPPRIDLTRLTNTQYRNSLTDLALSFRWRAKMETETGLKSSVAAGRRRRNQPNQQQKSPNVDPVVSFDFGEKSPDPSIPNDEFNVSWEGVIIPPETGNYEFVVKTVNGFRLWVNGRVPLIDGSVKSGQKIEARETIKLDAGRPYPIRLEMFKSKAAKEKLAAISLCWKTPHGVDEIIPTRFLNPTSAPYLFVLNTPFPPDDRSMGWERGTSVSKEWDAATTAGAIEFANWLAGNVSELVDKLPGEGDARKQALKKFAHQFVERAFRHPLSDPEKQHYVNRWFDKTPDADLALRRVVLLTLKSPRFLYLDLADEHAAFETASRLSYAMWDSLPDQGLWLAAANKQLQTDQQIRAQAERMLNDARAEVKLREFCWRWLKLDQIQSVEKDRKRFPDFDATLAASLRTSLELFVHDVLTSNDADFRRLLTEKTIYVNQPIRKFYQLTGNKTAAFELPGPPMVFAQPSLPGVQALLAGTIAADDKQKPADKKQAKSANPAAKAGKVDQANKDKKPESKKVDKKEVKKPANKPAEKKEPAKPTPPQGPTPEQLQQRLQEVVDSARYEKVFAGNQRAGVLTHPFVLSHLAYSGESSPIHRGVFLARGVLGVGLRPPPEAIAPIPPDLHPGLTTRERVVLQTKGNTCQSCHGLINPLGFSLEQFDAVGRFRTTEHGKPINSLGEYQARDGNLVTFKSARELADFLAQSPETYDAFIEQLFHHMVQQPILAYGFERPAELRKSFVDSKCNIRKLAVTLATVGAQRPKNPSTAAAK